MRPRRGRDGQSHTRRVMRHGRHTVSLGLSLPCGGKHTTGHGCPSTRGSGLKPATAGAPAGAGARGEAMPQSADSSARRLRRYRHWGAPASWGRSPASSPPRAARASPLGIPLASVDLWPCATRFPALPMGGLVAAIPDLRAVGSALLRPRPRGVESFDRAGRGPTPPSSTAAPSGPPPRCCLRGVPTTTSSRTNGRIGMPGCAAARGLVRAAADTAPSLDCPRKLLGCQAMFRSPVGAATRSNRCGALSHRATPQGAPRAPACGLPPSLPCPALAPQTVLWGWRAGSCRACHHQGLANTLVVRCAVTAPPWGYAVLPVCGRRSQALRVQAGHAQCLVELAWAGAPFGGSAPPNPCQAAAECRSIGLLLEAVRCCGRASVAATAPGRLAGTLHGGIFLCGRALAAASGSRLPRHFFCSWEAQCNACGATARGAASGAYPPIARNGSPPCHGLLRRHWEKRGKEQKK